jgi:signal transduction histidine kinase
MSAPPALLVRRWPERRPVVLAAAALALAGVAAAVELSGEPMAGVLYVLPVLLTALELGAAGGLAAAVVAAALAVAGGAWLPALVAVVVGSIAGRFSSRMHGVHQREARLIESASALGDLAAYDRLPRAVATTALQTPGVVGVRVALEGAATAVEGDVRGLRTATQIVARGERIGSIDIAQAHQLSAEERAALELLARQAALAADNQRLLVQEREAAAFEAELRHARDDLLDQRAGLGLLLDAQEDERRRHAETLHEDLAQALAGVMMQLRTGDGGSREDLRDEVRGVLAALREMATDLRPSTLGQLGLVPALEAIDGLTVEADGVPDPLPEPLRTGVYRLVEQIASAGPGARVALQGGTRLDVFIDAERPGPEVLAAAKARIALLDGSLRTEPQPDGRLRLRAALPLPT